MSLNFYEKRIANFLRKFVPGYSYFAILYKSFLYLKSPHKIQDFEISRNRVVVDCCKNLKGETFFGYYDREIENSKGDFIVLNIDDHGTFLNIIDASGEVLFRHKLSIWNYQQGNLCTWVNDEEIIFNDQIEGKVCAVLYNLKTQKFIYYSKPFQAISLMKNKFCSIDLKLLKKIRPEYSYVQVSEESFNNHLNK